ncbi:MAG: dTDP-4-dehydrorhamnose 3,5-epimerase family protein [Nanoarchaeota archaeon]|nr:dTDP-4-dehydrorhamnose 3,5-epimerase family protein [Nanoarchaeota archaeon]
MISGVIIKKIAFNEDSRGWLGEIYRNDSDPLKAAMCYVSHTEFCKIRGPHAHKKQSDFFVFIGPGDFELYLWDNRKNSSTKGAKIKIVVGESNKVSVLVPPGVVHGYKAISKEGSFSINLPNKLYAGKQKKEKVDEIRHEEQKESKFIIN